MANGMTMVVSETPIAPIDITALVVPQTSTNQMMGVTGGVMPNFGGTITVGGNISTSLLPPAPNQPTVSVNGLEYKQRAKTGTFVNPQTNQTETYEVYSVFPENTGQGTTYIDDVIYKQNNIPFSDTETALTRISQSNVDGAQRQSRNQVRFTYPSISRTGDSGNIRTISSGISVRYVYPTVK